MELSEILDIDDGPGMGIVARGRVPKPNATMPVPPDTTTYIPGLTTSGVEASTEASGRSNYTLFSLLRVITKEASSTSTEQYTTKSIGTGSEGIGSTGSTLLNVMNSTLAEVASTVTEVVGQSTTPSIFPYYNTTTSNSAASMWSTVGAGMTTNASEFMSNSTLGIPTTDNMQTSIVALESARAQLLRVSLWQWMSPFIFLFGFFGNIAILIVLATRPVMSDNTTSVYVRCLAIADLLTVITGIIPEWLAFCGIFNVEEVHPVSCKFYKFFAYTASDASIWILTAFSVERFIAVVFPFKRQKGWCKVFHVKIICVSLVVLGVAKNLQSFWTRGAEFEPGGPNGTLILRSNCGYPTDSDRFFNLYVRPWLVLVSINIVPMVILWFCNFSVIWTISRRRTIQRLQLQMSSASRRANALTQQVTIMCLCASFSFIIFMTPSFILFIGKAYWADDPASRGHYLIAKAVNNQLMYINNSINFYLYLFSGERFRDSVISIFIRCQWNKAVRDARSISLHQQSTATASRIQRGRRDPYEVAVVSNNGALLRGSREATPSNTPLGSRESLTTKS